mgnify:FL=1
MTKHGKNRPLNQVEPINEKGESFAEGSQTVHGSVNVYGSYIHGIFDGEGIAAKVVEALLAKKGLTMEDVKVIDYKQYKEQQYDILAENIRKNLDMKRIYEIVEKGV